MLKNVNLKGLPLSLLILSAGSVCHGRTADTIPTATLKINPTYLDWKSTMQMGAMYSPQSITMGPDKPDCIKKEPVYRTKPQYGVLIMGNGPHSRHGVAVDEPDGADARIYIDLKGDGDLTGTNGAWDKKTSSDSGPSYQGTYVLRASYGTPEKETSHASYGLNLYRSPIRGTLNFFRAAVREGQIKIDGAFHDVLLTEDGADGIFDKHFDADHPRNPGSWIMFDHEKEFDARGTFEYAGHNFAAKVSPDGSQIELIATKKVVKAPAIGTVVTPPLLSSGVEAPDFTVLGTNGQKLKLSDLRGKIVVVDFWATWCGPCQASLPHLQKVHEEYKDKNVYVLAVNVWDDRPAYEKWVQAKKQYTFHIALDEAGRGKPNIPTTQFKVSGIPTSYVIGPDGKVAAALVGYDGGDHRLEDALDRLVSKS